MCPVMASALCLSGAGGDGGTPGGGGAIVGDQPSVWRRRRYVLCLPAAVPTLEPRIEPWPRTSEAVRSVDGYQDETMNRLCSS